MLFVQGSRIINHDANLRKFTCVKRHAFFIKGYKDVDGRPRCRDLSIRNTYLVEIVATPHAGHKILVGENVISTAGENLCQGVTDGLYPLFCLAAYLY